MVTMAGQRVSLPYQRKILEDFYQANLESKPSESQLQEVSKRTGLSVPEIEHWFSVRKTRGTHKGRATLTIEQVRLLNWVFQHYAHYVTGPFRERLAKELGMTSAQVGKWFEQRRQRGPPSNLSKYSIEKPQEWDKKIAQLQRIIQQYPPPTRQPSPQLYNLSPNLSSSDFQQKNCEQHSNLTPDPSSISLVEKNLNFQPILPKPSCSPTSPNSSPTIIQPRTYSNLDSQWPPFIPRPASFPSTTTDSPVSSPSKTTKYLVQPTCSTKTAEPPPFLQTTEPLMPQTKNSPQEKPPETSPPNRKRLRCDPDPAPPKSKRPIPLPSNQHCNDSDPSFYHPSPFRHPISVNLPHQNPCFSEPPPLSSTTVYKTAPPYYLSDDLSTAPHCPPSLRLHNPRSMFHFQESLSSATARESSSPSAFPHPLSQAPPSQLEHPQSPAQSPHQQSNISQTSLSPPSQRPIIQPPASPKPATQTTKKIK